MLISSILDFFFFLFFYVPFSQWSFFDGSNFKASLFFFIDSTIRCCQMLWLTRLDRLLFHFFFLLIVAYDHINEHRVRVATKKSYSLRYSQLFKKVIPSRPIRTFVRTDRSVICRQLAFHSSNLIYSYLAMIRFYDCVITCSIHFECQLRWLQLGSILSSPVFSNPTRQVRLFVRG